MKPGNRINGANSRRHCLKDEDRNKNFCLAFAGFFN